MIYRYCGASGIQLPVLSLGLWHNFGSVDDFSVAQQMLLRAFDCGICHFDLANNYGPAPGTAEENFGKILRSQLQGHRDEILVFTKAGHDMWPGVYGTGSSRKNIIASCDQSLHRMGLDYVDIFYSHRYDGVTPVEETMQALVDLVRSGKALYVGISKYPPEQQRRCYEYLREHDTPCLVSQYRASMFNTLARPNLDIAAREGSGFICFSPLAQGLLTGKYLHGIPSDSRAAKSTGFLQRTQVTEPRIEASRLLSAIAEERGQTLPQMAIQWLLHDERVTSVILGTSSVRQLEDNIHSIEGPDFTSDQLSRIEAIISREGITL